MTYLDSLRSMPFWQETFLMNSVYNWTMSFVALVVFIAAFKIFQSVILWRLARVAERTKTDLDDAIIEIVQSVRPPFYSFLAFFLALQFLALEEVVRQVLNSALIVWVVYQAVYAVQIFINHIVRRWASKEEGNTQAAVSLLGKLSKGVLWTVGVLLILSNLGVNITSLVAGLGIGGVAVALALQNILSDLFSSFSLLFDKPFVVGDVILVGDTIGIVERIGIKTTRIRSLQGEEVVFSNQHLTSTKIQNFKRMRERRVVFTFGVLYETPTKKIEQVPNIIKEIIEKANNTRFDRAHFNKFGDSALEFEVVYYIASPDYNVYMDTQQNINIGIKKAFENEDIVMAYPTQTIYLAK